MARPHDYTALPAHPAVGTHYRKETKYGWTTVVADLTCPTCGKVRSWALYTIRQQMKRPNFTGDCRACAIKKSREGHIRFQYREKTGSRRVSSGGYVTVPGTAVDDADLPMFRAMQGKGGFVLEHRWNMAKSLGRPLRADECVDHMDGIKTNNDPANLRIYLKGKQQPGSCHGYGTYYHEWQMAEARNRLLMAEIERLRAR